MRTGWHHRPSSDDVSAWAAQTPPPLELRPVGEEQTYSCRPSNENGDFSPEQLEIAADALVDRRSDHKHSVHPRLVRLLYKTVMHFRAPYVHVISGFRETRTSSRHNQGRAADIALPGVSNKKLAAYLQTLGFVGVGMYPLSGFVHLDVRGESYFWTDRSGPGQRSRKRKRSGRRGTRADIIARAQGEEPVPDFDEEEESAESETTVVVETSGQITREMAASVATQ